MDTPHGILPLGGAAGLGDHRRIDEADQPSLRRLGRGIRQHPTDQQRQKIATPPQAVEQADVGDVDQPDRGGPGRHRPQPTGPHAVGQHKPQHIHRTFEGSGTLERFGLTRTALQRIGSAEPLDHTCPVPVQQRIASHPSVESQAIPKHKRLF